MTTNTYTVTVYSRTGERRTWETRLRVTDKDRADAGDWGVPLDRILEARGIMKLFGNDARFFQERGLAPGYGQLCRVFKQGHTWSVDRLVYVDVSEGWS